MKKWALFLFLAAGLIEAKGALPGGAILHFDVSQQREGRSSRGLPGIGNTQPVDLLVDSSDQKRLAMQGAPERRPIFVTDGSSAYLKFDGKEDYLAVQSLPVARELMIFLLAAPKENPGF